jgi:adenylate cyclase
MPAKLVLVRGEGPPDYPLSAFNTLGRHPDNSIQVLDRIVSKEHSRITLGPSGRYVIRDVGSLNGTYVNGVKVDEAQLKHGDQLGLGNTLLRFEDTEEGQRQQVQNVSTGQVQSQIRSRVRADAKFLPAASYTDLEALKADYEKLRVAHELGQKLSVDADLDHLMQQIVDETFALIRADRAVILLADATGQLSPSYVRQKNPDEEVRLSTSILEAVRTDKQAVLSSDAMVDDRFKTAKSIIMQGIRSTMCVPLLFADQLVGAMYMDSMLTTGAFTEKDLEVFMGVATQAGMAIQNHNLAKKIEHEAATRAQFQRLLSPNLVEQVVQGALTLDQGGQRRDVTMLFADIRGFTSMSERHTPEQMVKTLNDYFEVMVDVLFRHGGTLDKYVGDEIIGLFGAPVPQADAPVRAVRCAIDMLRALEEHNRLRASQGHEPIAIGIGINSGPVIAGAIGSSQTLQYTVIGDAVNLASRLCNVAKAGEVIISATTMAACGHAVIAEAREPVHVKGKTGALPIYCAREMRDTPVAPHAASRSTQSIPTNS